MTAVVRDEDGWRKCLNCGKLFRTGLRMMHNRSLR